MKIRDRIIHEASHEAEKNKVVRYETISSVEWRNTHAKVYVNGMEDGEGNKQPVFLINADFSKMPQNIKRDYGVLILSSSPGRYENAVGILIRRDEFEMSPNTARNKI